MTDPEKTALRLRQLIRKPFWWQIALQGLLPVIITLLLGWGANKVHEMGVTLAVLVHTTEDTNVKVINIEKKLNDHQDLTENVLKKNSQLHHHRAMKVPCTGCHLP